MKALLHLSWPGTFKVETIRALSVILFINVALLLVFAFAQNASAREIQGRLGLGYNNEFGNAPNYRSNPAVSLKYGLSRDFAVEGIVGIYTGAPGNSVAAGKVFKNIFLETNLNFYFMAGFGVLTGNSNSGIEALGGFGAEFFIPGIESLGFAVETGGTFNNMSGAYALRTLGVSFLDAGIHFYF
ncbi:hypothetical protein WDW86_21360 [Bdellovibrionota bacterium FG-2]